MLKKAGIEVKSHMSSLTDEQLKEAEKALKAAEATKEEKKEEAKEVKTQEKEKVPAKKPQVEVVTEQPPESPKEETPKDTTVASNELIEIPEGSTVKEFAEIINKEPNDIITLLFQMGEMVTITQSLSDEDIHILADEMGFDVKIVSPQEAEEEEEALEGTPVIRPPVVTIMGHVDHGKTKLLDSIRKTNVVSTEAGGITQHIGAYQVVKNDRKITFIDTPGHEAFTAMRARGAQVTDIAILVVAADDGVKPQTIEAIDHARAASVPIIVAINKIDKPEANIDKVRQELVKHELTPEEWGGQTIFVDVSAKEGTNIKELLEMILLVADVAELKAVAEGHARGTVIEAKVDKGRGPVATVLIQEGTLKHSQPLVAGAAYGKVRAIFDDLGRKVKEAGPSQPVEILGFANVPHAGDILKVVHDEREARSIAEKRALKQRLIEERQRSKHLTLEDLHLQIQQGMIKDLNLIVKADVQGSIGALSEALAKIKQEEVKVKIIHTGVGAITETDVMLAAASNAIVVGFNVRPSLKAKEMAEKENVDVRTYKIIYELIEDINAARVGMLTPGIEEVITGEVEVRETFKVPKIGVIAGCYVNSGEVNRNSFIRIVREGVVVSETKIASLKRFKNDVGEVKEGYECGIGLENFQDIKVGDIFEVFIKQEVARSE